MVWHLRPDPEDTGVTKKRHATPKNLNPKTAHPKPKTLHLQPCVLPSISIYLSIYIFLNLIYSSLEARGKLPLPGKAQGTRSRSEAKSIGAKPLEAGVGFRVEGLGFRGLGFGALGVRGCRVSSQASCK